MFSWPEVVGVLGGVATVCLTLLKMINMKNHSEQEKYKELRFNITKLDEKLEVCKNRINQLDIQSSHDGNTLEHHSESITKLEDLILKLLTEK